MPETHATVTTPGLVLIDRMVQRCSTPEEFPVARGSSLAADDIASGPYPTSHVLRMCLTAGMEHLHAAKVLVVDQQVPHTAASWSLARGALENLATAYWILRPDRRDDRIERTLRWHAQNVADSDDATRHRDPPNVASAETRLSELDAVARRRMLDPDGVRRGCSSMEAVEYAEASLPQPGFGVRFPWQLSSGFSHGRPWAPLGASALEMSGGVLFPYLAAVQLLEAFLRLYEQRANKPLV